MKTFPIHPNPAVPVLKPKLKVFICLSPNRFLKKDIADRTNTNIVEKEKNSKSENKLKVQITAFDPTLYSLLSLVTTFIRMMIMMKMRQ